MLSEPSGAEGSMALLPFAHCPGVMPPSALIIPGLWGQSQGKLGRGGPSCPECSWTVQNTPRAMVTQCKERRGPTGLKSSRTHGIVGQGGGPVRIL